MAIVILNFLALGWDLYKFTSLKPLSFAGVVIPQPWDISVIIIDIILILWSYYLMKRAKKNLKSLEWRK